MKQQIESKLTSAFSPSLIEVEDESHKHAGHAGARPTGETHFKVKITSEDFAKMNRVKSHQAIYAALADELSGERAIHALSLDVSSGNI